MEVIKHHLTNGADDSAREWSELGLALDKFLRSGALLLSIFASNSPDLGVVACFVRVSSSVQTCCYCSLDHRVQSLCLMYRPLGTSFWTQQQRQEQLLIPAAQAACKHTSVSSSASTCV